MKEPSPELVLPTTEEKRDPFGLPPEWAKEKSLEGLEEIRLHGIGVIDRILSKYLVELEKFGVKDSSGKFISLNTVSPETVEHLRMNMEEKVFHFKSKFPKGFIIMKSDIFIEWEKIVPYELWAIRNHQQTLYTLNRRGGVSIGEASAIRHGVPYDNEVITSVSSETLINWVKNHSGELP